MEEEEEEKEKTRAEDERARKGHQGVKERRRWRRRMEEDGEG